MKYIKLGSKGYAKVSGEDFERLSAMSWYMNKRGYVVSDTNRSRNRKVVSMHHMILEKKQGFDIDHKNRDKLDNTRENLRYLTRSLNAINSKPRGGDSGVTGVSWFKRDSKWRACIMINGKQKHLGYLSDINHAIIARRDYERMIGL